MKSKIKTRRASLMLIITVVLVLAVAGALLYNSRKDNRSLPATEAQTGSISPEEQKSNSFQADQNKENIEQENSAQPASNRTANPLISYAGQSNGSIEVIAFVPGLSEDNGRCTVSIARNQKIVTRDVIATRNAKTTDCSAFSIPETEFDEKGEWNVQVSYASTSTKGTSEVWRLTIQ